MPPSSPVPLPRADLDHVLAHTAGLWDDLRGRRLYVTGGTGFFGSWLLESFCHANREHGLGARMIVLTRDREAFARKAPHLVSDAALAFVTGDVRSFTADELRRQQPSLGGIDLALHCATEASAALLADAPLAMLDTIVQGTRATLALAAELGARRVLLASSGAVYGRQPPGLTHLPESWSGAPDSLRAGSAYGEGKRVAETLGACFQSAYGVDVVVARCFAFVGPHLPLDAHFAVGNFIRDAMAGRPIEISGDGTPRRSYLYAADLAVWLWTILLRGTSGRAYNVGSARDVGIAELAQRVADAIGSGSAVRIARQPAAGADVERYVPDVARAAGELGLVERIGLDDAIRRTVAWHRERLAGR